MSWLIRDEIVDLYNQKEYERAYWIDLRGETHFMGDMETSYLCNVIRFIGKNRHLDAAAFGLLAEQMAAVSSGPDSAWVQGLDVAADEAAFAEAIAMATAPWETPLVQNLVRHIEARAWELRQ